MNLDEVVFDGSLDAQGRVTLRQLSLVEATQALGQPGSIGGLQLRHPGAMPPAFVLQRAIDRVSNGEPAQWWLPFLIVVDQIEIAGGCAFKGAPRSGRAEILYGIAKAHRGRGIASAAVTRLAALAFEQGATDVLAEIEPGNAGSTGVVKRCGFTCLGQRTAEDGVSVERWILRCLR